MLFTQKKATEKRALFHRALKSGKLLQFPGAYSPLVAMLIEQKQFDGVYISGAVLANDLGLPDIGLTTLSEVAERGQQIARVTELPALIDIDTGFGGPLNVARTVQMLEEKGLSGCHLEDQRNPKRCGHLDNKELVSVSEMSLKVQAAVQAKSDPHFLIMARTDSRAQEGLAKAIDRAKAYVDAGAEMIFPEALKDESEFEAFRQALSVPLLANMTEFGKSPILTQKQLENLGYNLVIYPVTTMRLAMKNVEAGLDHLKSVGDQSALLNQMQNRKHLYEILLYKDYSQFDQSVAHFNLENNS